MTTSPPLPPLEAAWQSLRPILEWSDSFSLIFVFNGNSRLKEALYERAVDLMTAQAKAVQRPKPRHADDIARHLLGTLLDPSPAMLRSGMPLWLDLDAHPDDEAWDKARSTFLLRLNERRSTLAREHTRPVVIVLPHDWTKRAAETAPDLWTIRQPSIFLAASEKTSAEETASPEFRTAIASQATRQDRSLPDGPRRWRELLADNPESLSVWDGIRATDEALHGGFPETAEEIAGQVVDRARRGTNPRDLSLALANLGDAEAALGHLDAAHAAYVESEVLDRRLIDDFGSTPKRLRDLSISLSKLGDIDAALGRLDAARTAYGKIEALCRRLIGDFGPNAERLRDLSVSLSNLGDIDAALDRLDAAHTAYAESEALCRRLIDGFGPNPERLRDLAMAKERQGNLALKRQRPIEAHELFAEESVLAQRLVDGYGESASAFEIAAHAKLGMAQSLAAQGQYAGASAPCREALALYERLMLARPGDRQYAKARQAAEQLLEQILPPPEPTGDQIGKKTATSTAPTS